MDILIRRANNGLNPLRIRERFRRQHTGTNAYSHMVLIPYESGSVSDKSQTIVNSHLTVLIPYESGSVSDVNRIYTNTMHDVLIPYESGSVSDITYTVGGDNYLGLNPLRIRERFRLWMYVLKFVVQRS